MIQHVDPGHFNPLSKGMGLGLTVTILHYSVQNMSFGRYDDSNQSIIPERVLSSDTRGMKPCFCHVHVTKGMVSILVVQLMH